MAIDIAHSKIAHSKALAKIWSRHSSSDQAEPDASGGYVGFGLPAHWEERVVTAVAMSLALVIVAAVAVLMGMV